MQKKNIILIGMPATGKTTQGRMLAARLKYDFIDTDDVIREQNGCELSDIIRKEGLDGFKQREEDAICSVNCERTVIATGGSAIYSDRAMQHLRSIGRIVYLAVDYDTIARRIGDPKKRGVAIADGMTLRDLYDERTPLYQQYADVVVLEYGKESTAQSANRLYAILR